MKEIHFLITGVVQGVGFRPFCAKLAASSGLGGSVSNTSDGVALILRGSQEAIEHYIRDLAATKPDPADIHSIKETFEEECQESGGFIIGPSVRTDRQRVLIPPDIGTCSKCLSELEDPKDRRYMYPFINCTDCGPRFTIVKSLPYDRPQTTMDKFPMCQRCRSEYNDVKDRRFHAQPNACPECGPSLWTEGEKSTGATGQEAIQQCRDGLNRGEIWAIKGLGGFHLACNPFTEEPLKKLRSRKNRPDKPLALMVENMEVARTMANLRKGEEELLRSSRSPIVLSMKNGESVHQLVAPGQKRIGLMLPYTPLHHILLKGMKALVMTSANRSGQPLISDNSEALSGLSYIADGFLLHDRDIHMKVDDSLVATTGNRTVILRRGRGYVPNPVSVSFSMPHILAAGAEMKSTFSLTQENLIFPSQYLGDAKELETLEYYGKALEHFSSLYNIHPRFFVHDLHPLYLSTRWARKKLNTLEQEMGIQHHHAHLAACLAENDSNTPTIGVIMDGTGYGYDGTIWGGEFLIGDLSGFERVGSLLPAPLPGGDRSVMEPWRYALSLLMASLGYQDAMKEIAKLNQLKLKLSENIISHLDASPITTSCGRLFDGVSYLLGGPSEVTYDGQAAMELEALAESTEFECPLAIVDDGGFLGLDWRPAIRWIIRERPSIGQASGAFHSGMASAISEICRRIGKRRGIRSVALSGGVWQNCALLEKTVALLEGDGFHVLTHRYLSPNDESISVGQAAIGGWAWKNL